MKSNQKFLFSSKCSQTQVLYEKYNIFSNMQWRRSVKH